MGGWKPHKYGLVGSSGSESEYEKEIPL